MDIAFLIFAYTAGIFTFLSPCAFPILPSYISYFLSKGKKRDRTLPLIVDGIKIGLITSLGFLIVLTTVGFLLSLALIQIGKFIPYFVIGIGVTFAVLGILYLAGIRKSFNVFLKVSHKVQKRSSKSLEPFFYGIGYALAAMGCSLPIFLAIVSGSAAFSPWFAMLSLLSYFLGMSSLMIPISIITSVSGGIISSRFMGMMHYVERGTGLILLLTGLYLIWYEFRITFT